MAPKKRKTQFSNLEANLRQDMFERPPGTSLSDITRAVVMCAHFIFKVPVKTVCEAAGISDSVFYSIRDRYAETRTFKDRPKSGRPRKISPGEMNRMKICASLVPTLTANQLAVVAAVETKVSYSTLLQTLNYIGTFYSAMIFCVVASNLKPSLFPLGIQFRVRPKLPPLKDEHIEARKSFAMTYRLYDFRLWIFVDEARFAYFFNRGPDLYMRVLGEVVHVSSIFKEAHFDRGGLLVWGAISYFGQAPLVYIDGKLDKKGYNELVRYYLVPFMKQLGGVESFYVAQDNDPKHSANREAMKEMGIRLLPWPSHSPDMNIIEHCWSRVKSRLRESAELISTYSHLTEVLTKYWGELEIEYIRKLYDSYQDRLDEVIANGGWHTSYC